MTNKISKTFKPTPRIQLSQLKKQLKNAQEDLDLIYNSEGWALLQKLYLIRDLFFPKSYFISSIIYKAKKLKIFRNHHEVAILRQAAPSKTYQEKFPKPYAKKFLKISIVTPSYNQGQFIKHTIDSVLKQKYPNLEYFVQDGGSKDNTVEILKSYGNKISYQSKPDKGQTNAINLGIRHATGEIMAYLNSDDVYTMGALHFVNEYFQEHPDVDVVYGNRLIINQNGRQIGRWILPPHDDKVIKIFDYIPQETMFWRRSIWEKVGGQVDENFNFAMDWDLIIRFISAGANIKHVPYFLGMFRYHDTQKTSTIQNSTGDKECQIIRKRIHGNGLSRKKINLALQKYQHRAAIRSLLFDFGIRL